MRQLSKTFFLLFVILLALFLVSSRAFAVRPDGFGNGNPHQFQQVTPGVGQDSNSGNGKFHQGKPFLSITGEDLSGTPSARGHLGGGKLKACQAHEKGIQNRSTHLTALALNMEKRFDAIALGVENRYQTKLVPQGKTVTNYDALVAAIATQKAALLPLLQQAEADASTFSCNASDPKQSLSTYRIDMQAVITGLQAYKKAVRNLIVAVATLGGNDTTGSITGSPTGATTPTVTPATTPGTTQVPTLTPTVTPTESPTAVPTATPTP